MKSSSLALPCTALLALLLLGAASVDAITCSDVIKCISPCATYLKSGSGMPPGPCCAGAKALASSATTTADRQIACNCIKTASQSLNMNYGLASSLPGNCGIKLGFTIAANMVCSTIR